MASSAHASKLLEKLRTNGYWNGPLQPISKPTPKRPTLTMDDLGRTGVIYHSEPTPMEIDTPETPLIGNLTQTPDSAFVVQAL